MLYEVHLMHSRYTSSSYQRNTYKIIGSDSTSKSRFTTVTSLKAYIRKLKENKIETTLYSVEMLQNLLCLL